MGQDDDRRVRAKTFQIVLEPFELLVSELAQPAGLKIQNIDQSNEMAAVLVEAVPPGAFGFDTL